MGLLAARLLRYSGMCAVSNLEQLGLVEVGNKNLWRCACCRHFLIALWQHHRGAIAHNVPAFL